MATNNGLSPRHRRLITARYTNRPLLLSELDWPLVWPSALPAGAAAGEAADGLASGPPPADDCVFSAGALDVAEPDSTGPLDSRQAA